MDGTLLPGEEDQAWTPFVTQQIMGGRLLSSQIAELQSLYVTERAPWVITLSGGKDSVAALTLMYLALLGIAQHEREHCVYVVHSCEGSEARDVFTHTLAEIRHHAARKGLPIALQRIDRVVHGNKCDNHMDATSFAEFMQSKFPIDACPIVLSHVRGSGFVKPAMMRYQPICSQLDESHPAYRRYMPLIQWSARDVWRLLGSEIADGQYEGLMPWAAPWGGSHIRLAQQYANTAWGVGQGHS